MQVSQPGDSWEAPKTASPRPPGAAMPLRARNSGSSDSASGLNDVMAVEHGLRVAALNISDPLEPCNNLMKAVTPEAALAWRRVFELGATKIMVSYMSLL